VPDPLDLDDLIEWLTAEVAAHTRLERAVLQAPPPPAPPGATVPTPGVALLSDALSEAAPLPADPPGPAPAPAPASSGSFTTLTRGPGTRRVAVGGGRFRPAAPRPAAPRPATPGPAAPQPAAPVPADWRPTGAGQALNRRGTAPPPVPEPVPAGPVALPSTGRAPPAGALEENARAGFGRRRAGGAAR
jgi:translation initiation factor IF-2